MAAAPWVGLDTEADSLHAYPEKLCLLQISIPDTDELVDPLAGLDLSPLIEALGKHELIIHGADYDLRLLHRTFDFKPSRIFETVWAARLLGIQQFGLTALVKGLLEVQLEKGSQTADWARRPLTPRMEQYARNDSRYLQPLRLVLEGRLRALGRLEWHRECCVRVISDSLHVEPENPDAVWRLSGSHRLGRKGLAVLRELWHWREREAIQANKPPYFVLNHETLVALSAAAEAGHTIETLFPRHLSSRRRSELMIALERGLSSFPATWPEIPRHRGHRMTDLQKRRFEQIKIVRDETAKEFGIDPTLIASKATVNALATDWEAGVSGLMNWQAELLKKAVP